MIHQASPYASNVLFRALADSQCSHAFVPGDLVFQSSTGSCALGRVPVLLLAAISGISFLCVLCTESSVTFSSPSKIGQFSASPLETWQSSKDQVFKAL
jgi:hypothetical protein